MWCWGWKQRGLVKYLMVCADNESAWEFSLYRAKHVSGVYVWLGNGFLGCSIEDNRGEDYKFSLSLMQRWRIHRKLKKIQQKLKKKEDKRKWAGFDSEEEMVLARLVQGTLTNEKAK